MKHAVIFDNCEKLQYIQHLGIANPECYSYLSHFNIIVPSDYDSTKTDTFCGYSVTLDRTLVIESTE